MSSPVPAPGTMAALLEDFLAWSQVSSYSADTIRIRRSALRVFIGWAADRGVTRAQEVTRPILQRYRRYLFHYRQKSGKPLSWSSQHQRLVCVRSFFKWLTRENHILYNPASELELPRRVHRLPRAILTVSEAEDVLHQAEVTNPLGLRDRALLETLYSTGMRRMEVIRLGVFDVDQEQGLVLIRQGKGNKDRMVPIGERATAWIRRYVSEVRAQLVVEPDDGTMFLTEEGRPFKPTILSKVVKGYVDAAGVGKTGSCHLFRHTMATLMLENGADIRFIQQMLGHANLTTTQIYTQVSIKKLKEIHTVTHPARLGPPAPPAAADDEGDEPTAEDVLEILDLEADEESGEMGEI